MELIRVVMVDDHKLIREANRMALSLDPQVAIVAEGVAGEDLETLVAQHRPDVVLLDMIMPQSASDPGAGQFQAIAAVAHLREMYPDVRVIFCTSQDRPSLVTAALDAGARGYVLKSSTEAMSLAKVVRAVYDGEIVLSAEIQDVRR